MASVLKTLFGKKKTPIEEVKGYYDQDRKQLDTDFRLQCFWSLRLMNIHIWYVQMVNGMACLGGETSPIEWAVGIFLATCELSRFPYAAKFLEDLEAFHKLNSEDRVKGMIEKCDWLSKLFESFHKMLSDLERFQLEKEKAKK